VQEVLVGRGEFVAQLRLQVLDDERIALHGDSPGLSFLRGFSRNQRRISESNAPSAALAPSPAAMMICLNGTVVASPAANTPGTEVWPLASTTISPNLDSSTAPLSHSVLGTRPICTNTPSRSTRFSSPVARPPYV